MHIVCCKKIMELACKSVSKLVCIVCCREIMEHVKDVVSMLSVMSILSAVFITKYLLLFL